MFLKSLVVAFLLACSSPVWAAVSCSSPTNGTSASTTDATSHTTGSISVTGGDLILVVEVNRKGAQPAATPTISNTGTAITWTYITDRSFNDASTPNHRITLWRGISSGTQSITITFDYAGATHTSASWIVTTCSGVDTTTNQGVVQSNTNYSDSTVASVTATLVNAFGSASNATIAWAGSPQTSGTIDVESGSWTLLGTARPGSEANTIGGQFRADNDSTSAMTSSAGNVKWGAIIAEIAASVSTPETTFFRRRSY